MEPQDEQNASDAAFASRALAVFADEKAGAGLEARILADFDRLVVPRPLRAAKAMRVLHGLSEAVWPGAPVWQPASVLALSLIVGLAAGLLLPSSVLGGGTSDTTQLASQSVSLETPPSFDLSGGEL
jgi:hypothetical protein